MISAAVRQVVRPRAVRHVRHVVQLLALAAFVAAPAARVRAQQPITVPAFQGYVNDFANVIPADTRRALESLSERVNAATKGDLVVVTLPDLGGHSQEEVALEIGRQWKVGANTAVGDRARNAGVVILVVPKETASDHRGACRIETGQGAEGFITDATGGQLCRDATPQFIQQDYAGAITGLATSVAGLYAREFNVSLDGVPTARPARGQRDQGGGGVPIVLIIILIVVVLSIARRGGGGGLLNLLFFFLGQSSGGGGRGRGGWGSGGGFGGGGGGFGGFGGGGGFSGGGGGSNW